jgi:hypothetical protein
LSTEEWPVSDAFQFSPVSKRNIAELKINQQ